MFIKGNIAVIVGEARVLIDKSKIPKSLSIIAKKAYLRNKIKSSELNS
jgi:hypothetical protein